MRVVAGEQASSVAGAIKRRIVLGKFDPKSSMAKMALRTTYACEIGNRRPIARENMHDIV